MIVLGVWAWSPAPIRMEWRKPDRMQRCSSGTLPRSTVTVVQTVFGAWSLENSQPAIGAHDRLAADAEGKSRARLRNHGAGHQRVFVKMK